MRVASARSSVSLPLLLLFSLLCAASSAVAQGVTQCKGIPVMPITPGAAATQFNVSNFIPVFFSVTVPADIDPIATQLIVTAQATALLPTAWPKSFLISNLFNECPHQSCFAYVPGQWAECDFAFPVNMPWGANRNTSYPYYDALLPVVPQPPAQATSLTLSASLAPLVPVQMVFAIWLNSTAVTNTPVTVSASLAPIPLLLDAFAAPTYVAFTPPQFPIDADASYPYAIDIPAGPPNSTLYSITLQVSTLPCAAGTTANCADCLSLQLYLSSREYLPSLGENWWYPDSSSSVDYSVNSTLMTIYPRADNETLSDSRALLMLSGMSGGCALQVTAPSFQWACEPECSSLSTYGVCVDGVCQCDEEHMPSPSFPDCAYNYCWNSGNRSVGDVWMSGGGGSCMQACLNSLPVGDLFNCSCSEPGWRVHLSPFVGYYCAPYYKPVPWWPFPLASLVFLVLMVTGVIVLNVLARRHRWAEEGHRLIHPDETRSSI